MRVNALESSFSNKYNANLVKTTNSFFPKADVMGGQLKMQLMKKGANEEQKMLPPLRHKPKK
jgi:hypothetical protein